MNTDNNSNTIRLEERTSSRFPSHLLLDVKPMPVTRNGIGIAIPQEHRANMAKLSLFLWFYRKQIESRIDMATYAHANIISGCLPISQTKYAYKNNCGTSCCAAGFAALTGLFQVDGCDSWEEFVKKYFTITVHDQLFPFIFGASIPSLPVVVAKRLAFVAQFGVVASEEYADQEKRGMCNSVDINKEIDIELAAHYFPFTAMYEMAFPEIYYTYGPYEYPLLRQLLLIFHEWEQFLQSPQDQFVPVAEPSQSEEQG